VVDAAPALVDVAPPVEDVDDVPPPPAAPPPPVVVPGPLGTDALPDGSTMPSVKPTGLRPTAMDWEIELESRSQ
jgi:hypothetical protein